MHYATHLLVVDNRYIAKLREHNADDFVSASASAGGLSQRGHADQSLAVGSLSIDENANIELVLQVFQVGALLADNGTANILGNRESDFTRLGRRHRGGGRGRDGLLTSIFGEQTQIQMELYLLQRKRREIDRKMLDYSMFGTENEKKNKNLTLTLEAR